MNTKVRSQIASYAVAISCVGLATSLHWLAKPLLGDRVPFITFFPAVFVTAALTRLGPTLLSVVLSSLAAVYWFLPPSGSFVIGDAPSWMGLFLFSFFGVAIAWLGETLRRRSEQVFHERERFSVTLASIGDGVIVTDENAQVTFLNAIAEQLTGWTDAEARGKPLETVFRIINEQTRQPTENPGERALWEGRIVGLANHTILIAKSGAEKAIDDSAAPIRDQDGGILGVVLVFRDVSEQRAAQLEKGRLAAIVDSSEDAIIGQTFEGVVTNWNAGAERLFGFRAEEMIGQSLFSRIVPPNRKEELLEALKRVEQGERLALFESLRQHKDGHSIPVAIRISPIQNAQGEIVGASAIDRDISQQRAAEMRRTARLAVTQILAHEQQKDIAVAEILAAVGSALRWEAGAFWSISSQDNVIRCQTFWDQPARNLPVFREATLNRAFPPDVGLPGRVWKTGEPLWITDVTCDPNFPRAKPAQADGLKSGFAWPITGDQECLGIVEWFSRDLLQPDEDLLEMMSTICGQIGHFIERREAETRLHQSEERLTLALEAGRMGTWEWNIPTSQVIWSPTLEMIHGIPIGSFPGTFDGYQQDIHPQDRDRVLQTIQKTVEGNGEHHLEYRIVWPDGSVHWLEARGKLLRDESGQPVRLVGVCSDVSQRNHMEQNLRFLAEASKSLSSLIDYKSTLQKIAHLAVPGFADWCAVDMLDAQGSLERVAVAHVNPDKVQLAQELYERYPSAPDSPQGVRHVLRTGEPELVARITDEMLQAAAQDEGHRQILCDLDLKSYLCVPLRIQDETLGVITFVSAESGRLYGPEDLGLAEELAHRAAIAVENARLYQEVREADRRKDEFLAMLAHELRNPLAPIRSGLDILAMDGAPIKKPST